MVILRRDNFEGLCEVLERGVHFDDVPFRLDHIKQELEKEGWKCSWYNSVVKTCIICYRSKTESISVMMYQGKVPTRKNEFYW